MKIKELKNKAIQMVASAGAAANALVLTAHADGLSDTLQSSLTSISDRAIGALAAIMGIAALITGAMSIYDMAQGSKSNNPEQQDKGQKTLVAAIGMAVAAAVLLGIRSTVSGFITAAMKG